jgi:hypothetical protein
MKKHFEYIGTNIDRLVALEMRGQRADQGLIDVLYWKAREVIGAPLTMAAAVLVLPRSSQRVKRMALLVRSL